MRFASVAEVKDRLSEYLARARKKEELDWKRLAKRRLAKAWEEAEDALYDYL